MQILERFIESKYGDSSVCEDGIFCNEHFIAVIDGVTPKGVITWDGHSSGYYAKETILKAMEGLTGNETAEKTLQLLNTALYEQYTDRVNFFRTNPEERLQATLVIYSVNHRQVWCFGDCQFMINGDSYTNGMKIDNLLAEVRSVFLRLEILSGKSVEELCAADPSYDIILPLLKKQFYFSNHDCDYGFSVLDGFCENFDSALIHDVPVNSEIILASDGYPVLKCTLGLCEAAIQEIHKTDPLCINQYKSTRGFTNGKHSLDDRAFIKFIV